MGMNVIGGCPVEFARVLASARARADSYRAERISIARRFCSTPARCSESCDCRIRCAGTGEGNDRLRAVVEVLYRPERSEFTLNSGGTLGY